MPFVANIASALALIVSLGSASPAQVPGPPPAPADIAEVLAFERDKAMRMTVPVTIDGQGPYRFLVDTGAERTVISRELARSLDLAGGADVRLHSMSEASNVGTFVIPRLKVSSKDVTGISALGLSQSNLGADGMLGVDSLKFQRVVFDFKGQTMTVSPSFKTKEKYDRDAIVVTARSLFGRLILADATADGEKVWVIVDTGSQASIGNEALRRKLAKRGRLDPTIPMELVSVTGGLITANVATIDGLTIGGVTFEDLPIAFADVHPFHKLGLTNRPALLLGMNAMKAFDRVSIDFANRKVRFVLPDSSSRADETRLAALR